MPLVLSSSAGVGAMASVDAIVLAVEAAIGNLKTLE